MNRHLYERLRAEVLALKRQVTLFIGGGAGGGITELTGNVTATGPGSAVATIANDAVTNAKLANMAASTIKARKTASTGDPEDCTLSEVLDFIGSAAQGDILYRGATGWARLGAGTSGHFLKTLGAGANPLWAVASGGGGGTWALAATWTYSVDVAQVDFTGLGGYGSLVVVVRLVTKSVSGNTALVVSTDNGSTFYTTSGDYVFIADTGVESNVATLGLLSASATAARTGIARVITSGVSGGPKEISLATRGQVSLFVASTDPINALRIFNPSGGNLTGGTIYVFGAPL